jgi:hypothetical protein
MQVHISRSRAMQMLAMAFAGGVGSRAIEAATIAEGLLRAAPPYPGAWGTQSRRKRSRNSFGTKVGKPASRYARATGRGSYTEQDALTRAFGAEVIRWWQRGGVSPRTAREIEAHRVFLHGEAA